jgi:hypothetical protein
MLWKTIIASTVMVVLTSPGALALQHPVPGAPCPGHPKLVLTGGPAGCVPRNSRLGQIALHKHLIISEKRAEIANGMITRHKACKQVPWACRYF